MSGEKRPDGLYLVKFNGCDAVARYRSHIDTFEFGGRDRDERWFDEIGPPCSRDDAEQLAKAREVLRRILAATEKLIYAETFSLQDIIDESGVRL